jgi:REP element-mobilizing transposase RayT
LDKRGARGRYLELLERAVGRTDARLLAYCLMSNHVHLVVVQGREPLERLVKPVHTGFAGWINAGRRKAQGPVFAGRPRVVVVEQDAYLLQLVRYVHNNPVRAGVVRHARSSDWSSLRAYVG